MAGLGNRPTTAERREVPRYVVITNLLPKKATPTTGTGP
jgi:hypothetical protein